MFTALFPDTIWSLNVLTGELLYYIEMKCRFFLLVKLLFVWLLETGVVFYLLMGGKREPLTLGEKADLYHASLIILLSSLPSKIHHHHQQKEKTKNNIDISRKIL